MSVETTEIRTTKKRVNLSIGDEVLQKLAKIERSPRKRGELVAKLILEEYERERLEKLREAIALDLKTNGSYDRKIEEEWAHAGANDE
jgi:hypothetical protein